MRIVSYSEARNSLKSVLDAVADDQDIAVYDHLDEDLKAELPLKRVWMVAAQAGE